MERIPYLLFIGVFFLDFLAIRAGVLPRVVTWLPDLFAGAVALVALLCAGYTHTLRVAPKYLVLFALVCLCVAASAILNGMSSGTLLAGIRNYFKYTPFFILPLVWRYTDAQFRRQLVFLLGLAVLQVPLALVQRFVQHRHVDFVTGSLTISSILSMFLIASIVVLLAFRLRGQLSWGRFLALAILLFIPTTINDTKGAMLMLPLAIAVVVAVSATDWRKRMMYLALAGSGSTFVLLTAIVLYDATTLAPGEQGLARFLTDRQAVSSYLYSGTAEAVDPGTVLDHEDTTGIVRSPQPELNPDDDRVARFDGISLAYRALREDPLQLAFGLGIGNVSRFTVPGFSGEYDYLEAFRAKRTALDMFLWECGLLGTALFLLFFAFVLHDTRRHAQSAGATLSGAFALGWTGVVAIIVFSLVYKNFMVFDVLGFLFWYGSGYVVASRWDALRSVARTARQGNGMAGLPSQERA
jgi:hypothetical protein